MKKGEGDMSGRNLSLFRMSEVLISVFILIIMFGCGQQRQPPQAEKIFINGHIVTMDDANPEAEAFAIGQGKILSVGSPKKIRDSFPGAEVIDLDGKTVMPGIIESHGHLLSLGQIFLELNVEGVGTPAGVIARVAERAKETPPGQWITGWGWDEGAWARNYPTAGSMKVRWMWRKSRQRLLTLRTGPFSRIQNPENLLAF
jgi:hypothetical protein